MSSVVGYWVVGLLAVGLAAIRLYAWVAVGLAIGAGRAEVPPAARTALALLAGACLTMAVYASLTAAGMITTAIALDAAIGAVAIVRQGRRTLGAIRDTARLLVPGTSTARAVLAAALALLVIIAVGPPRDADVMHYHLAHIRQIIADGRWKQLPICSYGIPFGWSLTYLPFERAGLPQAAHFVNLGAWLATCSICVESAGATVEQTHTRTASAVRWLLLCLTLLPAVIKAATTAMADAFLILVVALTLALLVAGPRLERGAALALGFAAYAGLTTRYQAAAVAIAATVIILVGNARGARGRPVLGAFAAGAAVALLAAAPFYAANAAAFGSPVWPFAGGWALGDRVAHSQFAELAQRCASIATAGGDWTTRIAAAGRLMVDRTVFPIPLLLVFGSGAALVSGSRPLRRIALFAVIFVGVWAIAQPSLAPRFSLYLLPAAVMCAAPILAPLIERLGSTTVRVAAGTVVGSLALVGVLYARDYLTLAVSGDTVRFHRATWYWPAYDWANHRTPPESRFAVVLYGGHTYPLDRWNISGDPGSSAEVPWDQISTGAKLVEFLEANRVDFVFYGPNVWTGRPMSERVDGAVSDAIRAGALDTVRTFRVPIVYGRMFRREKSANIVLLRPKR